MRSLPARARGAAHKRQSAPSATAADLIDHVGARARSRDYAAAKSDPELSSPAATLPIGSDPDVDLLTRTISRPEIERGCTTFDLTFDHPASVWSAWFDKSIEFGLPRTRLRVRTGGIWSFKVHSTSVLQPHSPLDCR
jgi:hypothetical protein